MKSTTSGTAGGKTKQGGFAAAKEPMLVNSHRHPATRGRIEAATPLWVRGDQPRPHEQIDLHQPPQEHRTTPRASAAPFAGAGRFAAVKNGDRL